MQVGYSCAVGSIGFEYGGMRTVELDGFWGNDGERHARSIRAEGFRFEGGDRGIIDAAAGFETSVRRAPGSGIIPKNARTFGPTLHREDHAVLTIVRLEVGNGAIFRWQRDLLTALGL